MDKMRAAVAGLAFLLFLGISFADLYIGNYTPEPFFSGRDAFIFFFYCVVLEFIIYCLMIEGEVVRKFIISLALNTPTYFLGNMGIGGLFYEMDFPLLAAVAIIATVVFLFEGVMIKYLFKLETKRALLVSATANFVSLIPSFFYFFIIPFLNF